MSRYDIEASTARSPTSTSTASGHSMKPACATDDHASRRTACCWRSASTFPTVIVTAATTASNGCHAWENAPKARSSTSSRPTRPAALETTDRYAATGTGEPTYTSGTHAWNGTAATL